MIDVCRLSDGQIVELIRHREPVRFASGTWSLVGELNKRPRRQNIWWVKTSQIAGKWSFTSGKMQSD